MVGPVLLFYALNGRQVDIVFFFSDSFDILGIFMSVVYIEVLKCGTLKSLHQTVLDYIGFNLK